MEYRICNKCGISKSSDNYRHRSGKCWDCVIERNRLYKQTSGAKEKARIAKQKRKERENLIAKNKMRDWVSTLDDRYIINLLISRGKYTLEYIKGNPEIIEIKRIQVLQNRLKKKIESVSDKGMCTKCKRFVPVSEFRFQKATDKKTAYTQHICRKCRKSINKNIWQITKTKTK